MRVYISADMEGASGVVHSAQTEPGTHEYERACALMLGDVNAVIEGAVVGGASYILVNDAHWSMRNLRIEDLHPAAELISGSPKPFSMVQGIDDTFDAAFFVGYHAMMGSSPATIDHTYTDDSVYRVTINNVVVGELGINALFVGLYGVPVSLVTGDQTLATEARALLGDTTTVQVKEAYSRSAARCFPLSVSRRLLREGAQAALANPGTPFTMQPPYTLQVDFVKSSHADVAMLTPTSERVGPRTVQFVHNDYYEIYRAWRVMFNLAE